MPVSINTFSHEVEHRAAPSHLSLPETDPTSVWLLLSCPILTHPTCAHPSPCLDKVGSTPVRNPIPQTKDGQAVPSQLFQAHLTFTNSHQPEPRGTHCLHHTVFHTSTGNPQTPPPERAGEPKNRVDSPPSLGLSPRPYTGFTQATEWCSEPGVQNYDKGSKATIRDSNVTMEVGTKLISTCGSAVSFKRPPFFSQLSKVKKLIFA